MDELHILDCVLEQWIMLIGFIILSPHDLWRSHNASLQRMSEYQIDKI
jgi:hypothetical protein